MKGSTHGLDSGPETDWRTRGKCLDVDPDAMFPPDHDSRAIAAAQAVCRGCPVTVECLAEALRTDDRHGIRAGFTGPERARIAERGIRFCIRCHAGFVPRLPHQKRCRSCTRIVDPRKDKT